MAQNWCSNIRLYLLSSFFPITNHLCYGTTIAPSARGSFMSLISQICGTVTRAMESGSNWTGSRQAHPSHVVSLSWAKADWGEHHVAVLVSTSSETRLARGIWQTGSWTSDIRVVFWTGVDNVVVIYFFLNAIRQLLHCSQFVRF